MSAVAEVPSVIDQALLDLSESCTRTVVVLRGQRRRHVAAESAEML